MQVGLRVPTGDTVVIGNVTITKSSSLFNVVNATVNTVAFTLDGVTYGPGQGLKFDLQVPNALTNGSQGEVCYFDVAYTTQAGTPTVRKDRFYVMIRDSVPGPIASPTAGPSLGQSSVIDNMLSTLGVLSTATDLDTFTGAIIPNDSTVKSALQAIETSFEATKAIVDASNDIVVRADATGATDAWTEIQAAIDSSASGQQMVDVTTGSSIYIPLRRRIVLPKGIYAISQPLVVAAHNVHLFGPGAVIKPHTTFYTNAPHGWALECGEQTSNVAIIESKIEGLSFVDFKRGLRLGQAQQYQPGPDGPAGLPVYRPGQLPGDRRPHLQPVCRLLV